MSEVGKADGRGQASNAGSDDHYSCHGRELNGWDARAVSGRYWLRGRLGMGTFVLSNKRSTFGSRATGSQKGLVMQFPHPPTGHAVLDLIRQGEGRLADASLATNTNSRFAMAHLAALRAAAAVLAARANPAGERRRSRSRGPRNVWELLPSVAPELGEWATYFGANADKRAAAEAGLRGVVTQREADDLLRSADTFLTAVVELLGLPFQAALSDTTSSLLVS